MKRPLLQLKHPLDPIEPHKAAATFGRMRAQGLLELIEIRATLAAAARDNRELRLRLIHAEADAHAAATNRRSRAAYAVAQALVPLLQARAPAALILHAALKAADDSLLPGEPATIAAEQAVHFLRRRK